VFEADDIRDWRGKDVVDVDGSKIGTLEAVYFDALLHRRMGGKAVLHVN
jgi:sporulation protein YlmC with PRC-barrel domain